MITTLLASLAAAAPVSISVYAPYGYQPGGRISLTVPLTDGGLFVRPRLGGFTRPHNHISAEIGADLGLSRQSERWYRAAALGGSYLAVARVTAVSLDVGSGSTSKTRELIHQAVPALSLEAGRVLQSGLIPFTRLSGGWKFSSTSHAFYAIELGIQMGETR